MAETVRLIRKIRIWLALFIAGLVLSGITAFPLERETASLNLIFGVTSTPSQGVEHALHTWLRRVHQGVANTNREYPFMAYGTDWLAFAHLALAVLFVGPLVDPIRNKWVLQFGFIACAGVLALALIAGPLRGIPIAWRIIDCSFGVFGAIPLLIALRKAAQLEVSTAG